jgi:aminoglycoside phosphotransferase (APT) family kinase protein
VSDDAYTLFESSGRVIDESLARRLIDSQFPQWSHLAITAFELDGWDNRSFRLGSELTIRLPSGNWYAEQVDKEQRWLPVLAPQLPLPIPSPVARGAPDAEFSHPWSVYRWLEGEPASSGRIGDLDAFATTLAGFLNALARIDATGGPAPGHGDVAAGNLLVRDGRLAAVLDFGSSGVGDPACDTVIAWTFLSASSRDRFRAQLDVDSGTWSRGRGWALGKALITLVGQLERDAPEAAAVRREIDRILADYAHDR